MNIPLKQLVLLFLCTISVNMLWGQAQRTCATMEYMKHQKEVPLLSAPTNTSRSRPSIITIPVVVHIIHNTSVENISDAQVLSQIEVLNEDFRRMNEDALNTPAAFLPIAADVEIEFCLATVDPNGFQTSGITRTSTTVSSFGLNDDIKSSLMGGQDPWNTAAYLNIWVGTIGGNILGYAQLPGGNANTDGIVIDSRYFGRIGTATSPFDLGRTTTHEVGHWLGLRHIWGDGGCGLDDGISDTPLASSPNYVGAPCTAAPNSCIEANGDQPDMYQNFMDYSDDGCMNLFTIGQKNLMRALFEPNGQRVSLLSSNGCANNGMLPTCADGFKNGTEIGIDCGGGCVACASFCADGLQNGNELGVDCGGACPDCPPSPTEVCTTAVLLSSNGVYTAPGPSMGMGATQALASHANWYYFIPPSNGMIHINSCGGGIDTRLWVYEGCCSNLIQLENSDDNCELIAGGQNWASEIIDLTASQGIVYYFEWDDRWDTDGFDFNFSFTPMNGGNIRPPITCPDCPTELRIMTAPAINIISESSCTPTRTPIRGLLSVPNTSCPQNTSLHYSINNGITFSPTLPIYDQTNPMTISTRCICNADPTVFSKIATITTTPKRCAEIEPETEEAKESIPTLSQWGKGIFGLLLLNIGIMLIRYKELKIKTPISKSQ